MSVLLVLLGISLFCYLRINGVPQPVLHEIVLRLNAAGLPVTVDDVRLTFRGWRAVNVKFYGQHPDDLDPVFHADRIYLLRRHSLKSLFAGTTKFNVDAEGVTVSPSVEWGIELPEGSALRSVEKLRASFAFLPDRIEISNGRLNWNGLRFFVDGAVLKKQDAAGPNLPAGQAAATGTALHSYISAEEIRKVEEWLRLVDPALLARAEVHFLINTEDYVSSHFDFSFEAEEFAYEGVRFEHVELVGAYAYPVLELKQALLKTGTRSARLTGNYHLASKQVEGALVNTLDARALLQLLPNVAVKPLEKIGLRLDVLPSTELTFGPAAVSNLLYTVSGPFSVESLGYQELEIRALQGRIESSLLQRRFEFKELSGSVLAQDHLAEQLGTAMKGGSAEGEVFWDGTTMEFGVVVEGSFDPNLLLRPLAFVPIATNIIHRFRFEDRPPEVKLSLGACVKNWKTFYINVQGTAEDLLIQNVPLSAVNVTAAYKAGVLRLDPVMAMQEMQPTKGSASIDFRNRIASFDVISGLTPAEWESLIYADLQIFGEHVLTSEDVKINARGTFDWGTMKATQFTAAVEAGRFSLPKLASLDRFSARVVGEGPHIAVSNALFGVYGGTGSGSFSVDWDPAQKPIPYALDAAISKADLRSFVSYCKGPQDVTVNGDLYGTINVAADFSTNFFATAKGAGDLKVKDGQLKDLPLFKGFSRLMRKVFPGFSVFSITKLRGNYTIANGAVASSDAYFEGDVLSAKGKGSYHWVDGFDATLEVQVFRESALTKVVQVITSPLMKLLKIKLTGPLDDPAWEMENF